MILRNEKNVKKKSVAVNNGHALKALAHEMWRCAAADLSALKGFGDVSQTRFLSVSAQSGKFYYGLFLAPRSFIFRHPL